MKAIILAAGRGKRMLSLTQCLPKCLLPLADTTILEHQLNLIRAGGISEIVIVTGFAAEKVRKVAGRKITYVHNSDYISTGSIYSLFLAADHLDSDLMLLNSDVLVTTDIMNMLVEEKSPNAIVVDFDKKLTDGEMNVRVSNGYVSEISKNIPAEKADAESVQLAKFDAESAKELRKKVISLIDNNCLDRFPTDAYGPVIKHQGLKAVGVKDKPWIEIDTPDDYQRACALNIFTTR